MEEDKSEMTIDKPLYCKSFKDGVYAVFDGTEDEREILKPKES
jgi:hypothetical protein